MQKEIVTNVGCFVIMFPWNFAFSSPREDLQLLILPSVSHYAVTSVCIQVVDMEITYYLNHTVAYDY